MVTFAMRLSNKNLISTDPLLMPIALHTANQRLSGISHSEPNQAREGVNKKRRQLLYLSMMEPAYTLLSLIDPT